MYDIIGHDQSTQALVSMKCRALIIYLAKEVMRSVALTCLFVFLSVYLFVSNIAQKVMNGL